MSVPEFVSWVNYRQQRGPLNAMVRMDYGFAMLARLINNALGGKGKLEDYLLWFERPEEAPSLENLAKIFGAKVKPNG